MSRSARLVKPDGTEEDVDMHAILTDPELAPLDSHEGVLKYFRQMSVPEPEAKVFSDGTVLLPGVTIYGS